jgi:hypothetical protein
MRLLLPVVSYLLLWRIFSLTAGGRRRSALQAATVWMTLLIAITELLSIPSLLTAGWLTLAWLVTCMIEALCLGWYLARRSEPAPRTKPTLSTADRTLLVTVTLMLSAIGALAVIAPPNIWDAMEYHLPRVILWVSNHSVRLFPTPDYAQLVFAPASEYAMLHFYLLWGSDRLVNLVDFLCFLGTIGGVSLIAQRLGAGIRGQLLAAVFIATVPEALLEASGAMTTCAVTFWIVTAVYFMLSFAQESTWANSIFAALAVGIALLTKGTAAVFLPLILLACWWMGSSSSRVRMLKRLPVLALLAITLNLPQFWRCYELTGTPLGMPFPDGGPRLGVKNARISVGGFAANVIRNVSVHTVTPSEAVNARIDWVAKRAIRLIGQDPNDPATVWPGTAFAANHFSLHEIHSGNPLHFAIITVVFLLVLSGFRDLAGANLRWYLAGILGAFVLFCALLRWQEWHSRQHQALFAVSAPAAGWLLDRALSKRAALVLAAVLFLSALPFVFSNRLRSYIPWNSVVDIYRPRAELYLADMHESLAPVYERMVYAVQSTGCHEVGMESYFPTTDSHLVNSPGSFFVYPLLARLKIDGTNLRVRYVDVKNLTAKYGPASSSLPACVVVCLGCAGYPEAAASYSALSSKILEVSGNEVFAFRAGAASPEFATQGPN